MPVPVHVEPAEPATRRSTPTTSSRSLPYLLDAGVDAGDDRQLGRRGEWPASRTGARRWASSPGSRREFAPTEATIAAIIPDLTKLHSTGFKGEVGWREGIRRQRHDEPPRPPQVARHDVRIGLTVFLTDRTIDPVAARRRGRSTRVRLAVLPRAHPHPRQPPHATATGDDELDEEYKRTLDPSSRSAAAAAVTRAAAARHRRLLVAQHDPIVTGQGDRHARPHVRRPVHARRRLRLERGRDGRPRRRRTRPRARSCASTCWRCRRCGRRTRRRSTAST